MALQRKLVARPEVSAPDPKAGTLALDRVIPRPTADARVLQERARVYAAGGQTAPKWSARRTLAFAVGASALLWGGLFAIGWAIVSSY